MPHPLDPENREGEELPLCVLVVVCSLSAFPAIASAECAWVLWQELTGISEAGRVDKEWGISGATSSEAGCNNQLRQAVQGRARQLGTPGPNGIDPGVRFQERNNSVTLEFKKGGLVGYTYVCLPDTIDPRGPLCQDE